MAHDDPLNSQWPILKKLLHRLLTSIFIIAFVVPVLGADKSKDEETIRNASAVLQAMVGSKDVPGSVLAKADCIIVLPSVKKFAIGIGGSGGRGPMTCRTGSNFKGKWSPPAMYSIGGASAGLQIGGTATDYVLVILSTGAVAKVLSGKVKIGSDVTAAAGPGASAGNAVGGADILTYSRTSGLFAGVSLNGATLSPDGDVNQRLYGKTVSASEVVRTGDITATPAGASFASLLDSKVPPSREPPVPTNPAPPTGSESGSQSPNPPPSRSPTTRPSEPVPTDDEILERALRELKKGTMAYNTPERMKTGQTAHVTARIASDSVIAQALMLGLPVNQDTKAVSTPISTRMKMKLTGADFDIVPLSSEEQIVGGDVPTTWEWDVVPKRSGKLRLHLAAIVVLHSVSKDFTTVDKEIIVQVDPVGEAENFVKQYWQWILTTVGTVVGAAWAWWRRRKKPSMPNWQTP